MNMNIQTFRKVLGFILITCGITVSLAVLPGIRDAQSEPLPACSLVGDKDLDGIPDVVDSDEVDSCIASSTGYEDCTTGAGDGLPDCS